MGGALLFRYLIPLKMRSFILGLWQGRALVFYYPNWILSLACTYCTMFILMPLCFMMEDRQLLDLWLGYVCHALYDIVINAPFTLQQLDRTLALF